MPIRVAETNYGVKPMRNENLKKNMVKLWKPPQGLPIRVEMNDARRTRQVIFDIRGGWT
jgi:hypothetical protein